MSMEQPYKVRDGIYIEGPGVTYRSVSEFDAEAFARFGNLVHARAHHTARRGVIEECVKVVEEQRRRTLDNDYHAAMTVIVDRLRAEMEKEP